jgi:hypothetical protein
VEHRRTAPLLAADARGWPSLEDPDLLRRGPIWVPLSPHEAAVARLLAGRFGRVVGRERLGAAVWPSHPHASIALTQLTARVRRRVAPLDLEIVTVWRRGYLMRDAALPDGGPVIDVGAGLGQVPATAHSSGSARQ